MDRSQEESECETKREEKRERVKVALSPDGFIPACTLGDMAGAEDGYMTTRG